MAGASRFSYPADAAGIGAARLAIVAAANAAMLAAAVGVSAPAGAQGPDGRKSGAEFMGESTRAMQRDDTQNPGMLWVSDGEMLWNTKAGDSGKSCAGCHGEAEGSMRGVAGRYPAFDRTLGRLLNLSQRIEVCRQQKQRAEPWKPESQALLGLESYVAMQSRGMPVSPPQDADTQAAVARGQALFSQRVGQLNLSCALCHDQNWGRKLAGAVIPQGHANAYPAYRLEWQGMGSLQRRLRNCMTGVRADVPPFGAPELVELEAYLAARAAGMPLETPGVRP